MDRFLPTGGLFVCILRFLPSSEAFGTFKLTSLFLQSTVFTLVLSLLEAMLKH